MEKQQEKRGATKPNSRPASVERPSKGREEAGSRKPGGRPNNR